VEFWRLVVGGEMLEVEKRGGLRDRIEEGFLDCASRLLRRSEAEKKMRRLASLGMTVFCLLE
jgi:hypothetical protein